MEALQLAQTTGYLIRRAQQAHVDVWVREVSNETTSVQFGILNSLYRTPGVSQRELVAELDIDRSTLGETVTRLERRKLLQRVRDAGDRRRNVLCLTVEGEREFLDLLPRAAQVDRILTEGLEDHEREQLKDLLRHMMNGSANHGT